MSQSSANRGLIEAENAIYTSPASAKIPGYRVTARSKGVSPQEEERISYRSLPSGYIPSNFAFKECIRVFELTPVKICITRVINAGVDAAGRPDRLHAHVIILSRKQYEEIGSDPYYIKGLGKFTNKDLEGDLPKIIIGKPASSFAQTIDISSIKRFAKGARKLTQLISLFLNEENSLRGGIVLTASAETDEPEFFRSLLECLPKQLRTSLTLTTFSCDPAKDLETCKVIFVPSKCVKSYLLDALPTACRKANLNLEDIPGIEPLGLAELLAKYIERDDVERVKTIVREAEEIIESGQGRYSYAALSKFADFQVLKDRAETYEGNGSYLEAGNCYLEAAKKGLEYGYGEAMKLYDAARDQFMRVDEFKKVKECDSQVLKMYARLKEYNELKEYALKEWSYFLNKEPMQAFELLNEVLNVLWDIRRDEALQFLAKKITPTVGRIQTQDIVIEYANLLERLAESRGEISLCEEAAKAFGQLRSPAGTAGQERCVRFLMNQDLKSRDLSLYEKHLSELITLYVTRKIDRVESGELLSTLNDISERVVPSLGPSARRETANTFMNSFEALMKAPEKLPSVYRRLVVNLLQITSDKLIPFMENEEDTLAYLVGVRDRYKIALDTFGGELEESQLTSLNMRVIKIALEVGHIEKVGKEISELMASLSDDNLRVGIESLLDMVKAYEVQEQYEKEAYVFLALANNIQNMPTRRTKCSQLIEEVVLRLIDIGLDLFAEFSSGIDRATGLYRCVMNLAKMTREGTARTREINQKYLVFLTKEAVLTTLVPKQLSPYLIEWLKSLPASIPVNDEKGIAQFWERLSRRLSDSGWYDLSISLGLELMNRLSLETKQLSKLISLVEDAIERINIQQVEGINKARDSYHELLKVLEPRREHARVTLSVYEDAARHLSGKNLPAESEEIYIKLCKEAAEFAIKKEEEDAAVKFLKNIEDHAKKEMKKADSRKVRVAKPELEDLQFVVQGFGQMKEEKGFVESLGHLISLFPCTLDGWDQLKETLRSNKKAIEKFEKESVLRSVGLFVSEYLEEFSKQESKTGDKPHSTRVAKLLDAISKSPVEVFGILERESRADVTDKNGTQRA